MRDLQISEINNISGGQANQTSTEGASYIDSLMPALRIGQFLPGLAYYTVAFANYAKAGHFNVPNAVALPYYVVCFSQLASEMSKVVKDWQSEKN